MATPHLNAPNSVFNAVTGTQINYNITQTASGPAASPSPESPFNDAPIGLLSANFTGRQKELAYIARALERSPPGRVPVRCVLYGNQGVGKSQLTYEWARSTFDRSENQYILWISATTVEKLDQGFSKLLHLVNHCDCSHSDQSVRLLAARRWLEDVESGNWLLVLDNVFPETVGFLREHLPRKNGRGSILFTTRTRNVAETLASKPRRQNEVVEVSLLDVKDGVGLFRGHFEEGESRMPSVKVEQIVKSVGCLPLAISHAAAFMKQSGSTLDDMLALYDKRHKFKVISWENTLSDYEHKSVAATFFFQLEDLEQQRPVASKLLKILACFDPENIPLGMLITGAEAISIPQEQAPPKPPPPVIGEKHIFLRKIKEQVLRRSDKGKGPADELDATPDTPSHAASLLVLIQSPVELRETIAQLQSRSLVACHDSSQTSSLRIHDLIQLVVLESSKRDGSERECFELAVQLACHAFEQIEDHRSPACWPQCEALVPHIQSLTQRQNISSKAKMQLLEANHRFAWYLESRGRYGEAETICRHVLSEWAPLFGSEDRRTLAVIYYLGNLCTLQGRNSEAEELLKQVLGIEEKTLGSHHLDTLTTMNQLAEVYISQGRHDQAEELLNKVVEGLVTNNSDWKTSTTDRAQYNLAVVYHSRGRYGDAEVLMKQVLQSNEKLVGTQHPNTLVTMRGLARIHVSQGRYSDAEVLYQRVLQSEEKLLGPDHPNTLTTQHSLGYLYHTQGRSKEAEALLAHVLSRQDEVLGPLHPSTTLTRDDLTSIRSHSIDDAEKIPRRPC